MAKQLESALALVKAGLPVFPAHGNNDAGKCTCGKSHCTNVAKHPAVAGWRKAATTDETQILKWWNMNPLFNPAIATGNGLVVLDVDGAEGMESLHRLEAGYGTLPLTPTARTGGEGYHYYFSSDRVIHNSVSRLGDKLDIRGDGGYVIAPGAQHRNGNYYEWEKGRSPADIPLAPIPEWILKKLEEKKSESSAVSDFKFQDDCIYEGARNQTLFDYGCFLRGPKNQTMREIEEALVQMNQDKCVPPVDDAELQSIICSVDKYARGVDIKPDSEVAQPRKLICAADIQISEARFVLNPYIPEGQLTMIQGNPGDGKTAFACKLAALLTRGESFMGLPCETGNVLMLSVEDDQEVLAGRIQASGGDLRRCFLFDNASGLTFGSPEIEEYIRMENIRLVIFDPIQAFIGADVDMNRANETRPVLAALKEMAKRNHCAVVILSHINKGMKDGLAIQRSLGSMDIPGACRSILHIGRLMTDTNRRLMVHVKSSNAREGKSVEFSIINAGGVQLEQFSEKGYEDLSTLGRKARKAAQDSELLANVLSACRIVLKENPNGAKVCYRDMDIPWPAGVRQGQLLESFRNQLENAGIRIKTGQRLNGGSAVMITPIRILEEEPA